MSRLEYLHLGGTLFIPASHKGLVAIVSEQKYPALKSLVIDFEDGLDREDILEAEVAFQRVLHLIDEHSPAVYVRARDTEHLSKLLQIEGIDAITGFVLAKFSLENAEEYCAILAESKALIMPSIEGEELFDREKLIALKNILTPHKHKIVLVRFGLEDMLRSLGMRRECSESIFDYSVTSTTVGYFLGVFKSAGYAVSGGVYPCFKDDEGFARDLLRDLKEGLFSKTIIHPRQIEIVNSIYRVSQREYEEAKEIVDASAAVFAQNGKMAEVVTMLPYSEMILKRAEIYGLS